MWNEPSKEDLVKIPKLYETESVPSGDKIVQMHFFLAGSDWYAVEFDGEDLFFGYVILNGDRDNAEWGYFSLTELRDIKVNGWLEVDRDLWWEPKRFEEASM